MLFRDLRKKRCFSQEELANLSGLSLRTIQRLESGHRVGYASLRSIAAVFDINVDTLEQELTSMEKSSSEYKDLPLWIRFYIGSGWFAASRKEFQKTELFFIIMTVFFGAVWVFLAVFNNKQLPENIPMYGFMCCFLGAYNVSISIRVGDKYDIWSRLEPTLPKGIFGLFKKKT